jgi:pyruvate dehydrogenase E1 component alpha subunit
MHSKPLDGQNVEEVYDIAKVAIAHIRNGKGPALVEANTFRFREHQEGRAYARMTETGYRDNDEVQFWIANKDPIKLFSDKLNENGVVTKCDIDRIYTEERLNIEEAVAFAEESPFPDKSEAYLEVFAGGCS